MVVYGLEVRILGLGLSARVSGLGVGGWGRHILERGAFDQPS